jgi:hypothetical protein
MKELLILVWCQLIQLVGDAMIEELERVVLTVDLPEYGLKSGDAGTIVHVYSATPGYLVEFVTRSGEAYAMPLVTPSQVRRLYPKEQTIARVVTFPQVA